jgi:CRISPR/Cas system-associated exonuclease Cas4 (RecB family)
LYARTSGLKADTLTDRQLACYTKCPRQFYYKYILHLPSSSDDQAYLRFHGCVYTILGWIQIERSAERQVTVDDALERLEQEWADHGPADHPYGSVYKQNAIAVDYISASTTTPISQAWSVECSGCEITFMPHHINHDPERNTLYIQRFRTGRAPKDSDDDIDTLYLMAAEKLYPDVTSHRMEVYYLTSEETVDVTPTPRVRKNAYQRYEQRIQQIRQGVFPPKENERECLRCAYYFICPAGDDHIPLDAVDPAN